MMVPQITLSVRTSDAGVLGIVIAGLIIREFGFSSHPEDNIIIRNKVLANVTADMGAVVALLDTSFR